MIIIVFISNIYAFCGLHPVLGLLSLNVKRQAMEAHRLSIKQDEPPGHLSSAFVPLMSLRESAWKEEGQAVFHVAHNSWPLITLLRSLVLPGPSGIGDFIVLILNLYPLAIKPTSPFGWICHGCSQLVLSGNRSDFSCCSAVCTRQRQSPLLSSHLNFFCHLKF